MCTTTPHYFIKVPENFANNKFKMNNFVSGIKNRLPYQTRNNLVAHDLVMRKDLWGFTNGKYFLFIRLIFKDTNSMNATLKIIKSEDVGEYKYKRDYDIYESNIPPFLRFIHKITFSLLVGLLLKPATILSIMVKVVRPLPSH